MQREKTSQRSRRRSIHLHRLGAHMLPNQRCRPRIQILRERKRLGHLRFAPRSLVQLSEEEVDVELVRRAILEVEEVGFGDLFEGLARVQGGGGERTDLVLLERDEDPNALESNGGALGREEAGLLVELQSLPSTSELLEDLR